MQPLKIGFVLLVAATARALAQPATDPKEADRLFSEARALIEAGRAAEACPLFEASYRFDAARGTLINLAACYEATGRRVDALRAFLEVERQASEAGDAARVTAARDRIRVLQPQVHRLTIAIAGTPPPDLRVEIDGRVVTPAQRADWPVEVGPAVVRATSSLTLPREETVIVPASPPRGKPIVVDLGALAPAGTVVVPPPPRPADPSQPPPVDAPSDPRRGRVILAAIVGGSGVALLGTSLVLALGARSDYNAALDTHCGGVNTTCTPDGVTAVEEARDRGTLATIIGGAGIAAVAVGAVLYFTAPDALESTPRVAVTPLGADGALVQLGGRF